MDPIRFYASPLAANRRCAGPPDARDGAPMLHPVPFYPLFDPATKWLGQGKAFEYAQQNVNLNRVSRRPQARPKQGLASAHGAVLGGGAWGGLQGALSGLPPPRFHPYRRCKRAQNAPILRLSARTRR